MILLWYYDEMIKTTYEKNNNYNYHKDILIGSYLIY